MTNDAKALIEEAIQVLDDNLNTHDGLVRASGTAMGKLASALAALSSPCACGGREPIAKGWLDRENGHIESGDGLGLHLRLYLRNDSPMTHLNLTPVLIFADEPQGGS